MEPLGAAVGVPLVALVLAGFVGAGRMAPGPAVAVIALVTWALLMLGVTVLPAVAGGFEAYVPPKPWNVVKLVPLATVVGQLGEPSLFLRQTGGNLAMFVPLGLLLPMVSTRHRQRPGGMWRTLAIATAASLAVEATQLGLLLAHYGIPRVFDVSDIILNTAGAGLGWAAYQVLDHLAAERAWWHQLHGWLDAETSSTAPR